MSFSLALARSRSRSSFVLARTMFTGKVYIVWLWNGRGWLLETQKQCFFFACFRLFFVCVTSHSSAIERNMCVHDGCSTHIRSIFAKVRWIFVYRYIPVEYMRDLFQCMDPKIAYRTALNYILRFYVCGIRRERATATDTVATIIISPSSERVQPQWNGKRVKAISSQK